ncbi:MAG: hypothetical protein M3258_06360 [Thermoproteota archaeon]|jgi:hypothetical protein|nr:hypothetical protein [Thermoproteota archaeon]
MVERKSMDLEEDGNYTKIKAARSDDQYLDVTSGKGLEDLTPKQQTCSICGLTARNKDELQDHITKAHSEAHQ